MPRYHQLGNIPHKRHTVFKKKDGKIHFEQLFGTIGFDGMTSLLYHLHPPTMVNDILSKKDVSPKIGVKKNMQMRALKGFNVPSFDDLLDSVKIFDDLNISCSNRFKEIILSDEPSPWTGSELNELAGEDKCNCPIRKGLIYWTGLTECPSQQEICDKGEDLVSMF